ASERTVDRFMSLSPESAEHEKHWYYMPTLIPLLPYCQHTFRLKSGLSNSCYRFCFTDFALMTLVGKEGSDANVPQPTAAPYQATEQEGQGHIEYTSLCANLTRDGATEVPG